MEFTLEELIEIKKALNGMIGQRIQYEIIETNNKRLEDNEKYKQLDYNLLDKVIKEINKKKQECEQLSNCSNIYRDK